ncbi:hypothetical protein [Leuconostoc citreum]|uniref:hypothetical protein n=1 Tax=Leuconostoc citreum TaxID=33964 RepID=UPI00111FE80D|nr:hypothetical protein [Leuconostoc citreum]TOY70553.1 hypothetical protein DIS12_03580 [Leuconostoc citreum]
MGNTRFMALFCYTLISNVIVFVIVSLDKLQARTRYSNMLHVNQYIILNVWYL